jgi:hypothetical protein
MCLHARTHARMRARTHAGTIKQTDNTHLSTRNAGQGLDRDETCTAEAGRGRVEGGGGGDNSGGTWSDPKHGTLEEEWDRHLKTHQRMLSLASKPATRAQARSPSLTHIQRERERETQTDRQTDRQTHTHTHDGRILALASHCATRAQALAPSFLLPPPSCLLLPDLSSSPLTAHASRSFCCLHSSLRSLALCAACLSAHLHSLRCFALALCAACLSAQLPLRSLCPAAFFLSLKSRFFPSLPPPRPPSFLAPNPECRDARA